MKREPWWLTFEELISTPNPTCLIFETPEPEPEPETPTQRARRIWKMPEEEISE